MSGLTGGWIRCSADGLVEEVETPEGAGLQPRDMVSMQGLGYKEILDYLEGEMCPGGGGVYPETGYQAFCQAAAHLVSTGTGCDLGDTSRIFNIMKKRFCEYMKEILRDKEDFTRRYRKKTWKNQNLCQQKRCTKNMGIEKSDFISLEKRMVKELKARFEALDETAEFNQMKVIQAMQKNRVSDRTFWRLPPDMATTISEGIRWKRYMRIRFHTEGALVRPQITCGTHALGIGSCPEISGRAMNCFRRSESPMIPWKRSSASGPSKGSLAEYGVTYRQVDLAGGRQL